MPFELKNNTVTQDRRLDRIFQDDPKNLQYQMRRVVAPMLTPRTFTWAVGKNLSDELFLNQGQEGECVGFSGAHELAAKPVIVPNITEAQAHVAYAGAQQNDEWPGSDYEGSSVLGYAKWATQIGFYKSYTWSKKADELAVVVSHKGPVLLGINWYEGMFEPDSNGLLSVSGEIAGGHAILCKGYSVKKGAFLLHNSWGKDWGKKGCALITAFDLQRLLDEDGEACLPLRLPYGKAIVW